MDPNVVKLSSTYPSAPMIYINNYTNDNVRLGLAPPPPPILKDSYSCFGKQIDPDDVLIKPLEAHNIKCLYKTNRNYKYELKKLNHSILMNYLDLLDCLVKAPNKIGKSGRTLREEKLEDLNILFLNMHHLINELRPKQARENLITILEMQKEQRKEIANKFQKHLLLIMDLLKQSINKIKINNNELNNLLNEFNNLIENNSNNNKLIEINSIEFNGNQSQQQQQYQLNDNNNNFGNINDLTQTIIKSTTKIILNQQNDKIEQENNNNNNNEQTKYQNYEYKDRVLCDIIDKFLNNKIEM